MKRALNFFRKVFYRIFSRSKVINYFYFGPIRKVNRRIRSFLVPKYVIVGRNKIYIDKYDTLNLDLNRGYGSRFFNSLVAQNIKEGDVVLNIGANIGYYTLMLAERVGKTGKVYAFEPAPDNFRLLKKNAEVNNYSNIVPINKAVSDKTGVTRLHLDDYNQGNHGIYKNGTTENSVEVGVVRLDDFLKNEKKIDFILMDAQGAELGIFRGMKNLLKKNKKIKIITEFSPLHLEMLGDSSIDFLNEIKNYGFNILDIDENTEKLEKKDFEQLMRENNPKNERFTDLLLKKD